MLLRHSRGTTGRSGYWSALARPEYSSGGGVVDVGEQMARIAQRYSCIGVGWDMDDTLQGSLRLAWFVAPSSDFDAYVPPQRLGCTPNQRPHADARVPLSV